MPEADSSRTHQSERSKEDVATRHNEPWVIALSSVTLLELFGLPCCARLPDCHIGGPGSETS